MAKGEEEVTWAPSPGIPKYYSPPSEVRKFIADALHTYNEVDLKEAEKISQRWQHRRGYEFLEYDIPQLNEILGDRWGTIISSHVVRVSYKTDYQRELAKLKIQSTLYLDISPQLPVAVGMLIAFVYFLSFLKHKVFT